MLQTILNLLPVVSILLSFYILQLLRKEEDANSLIEHNQELIENYILKNADDIKKLSQELSEVKNNISDWKSKVIGDIKDVENKVTDLYNRWDIVSDDRITSIPQNNKEWWDAKQIVAQTPQKVWKPKNLSQSKDGFVNENAKHIIQVEEIEPNQDFSQLSDEDFENILDDESDDKSTSGSSSATEHLQQQKRKPRKAPQNTV
jgi:hypothetical protein